MITDSALREVLSYKNPQQYRRRSRKKTPQHVHAGQSDYFVRVTHGEGATHYDMSVVSADTQGQLSPKAGEVSSTPEPLLRLERLSRLQRGWDGGKAGPPKPNVLGNARRVLELMLACADVDASGPHVAPGVEGEVEIEWRREGRELHVYCLPSSVYELLRVEGESSDESEGNWSAVSDAVNWFIGR